MFNWPCLDRRGNSTARLTPVHDVVAKPRLALAPGLASMSSIGARLGFYNLFIYPSVYVIED
jgi:hypothetical protein